MPNLNKSFQSNISVKFDGGFGTKKLITQPSSLVWDCDTFKTFLIIGLLTTPAQNRGISLSAHWAWIRYASSIRNNESGITLNQQWGEMDPHQKTILADDFGMGFPCHFLHEQYGFEDFVNTIEILNSLPNMKSFIKKTQKTGPAKLPDFLAIDAGGDLHTLECKGTQVSKTRLISAMKKGIDQKNNLCHSNLFKSCMVGGFFIPQYTSKKNSELLFIDPPNENLAEALSKLSKEEIKNEIRFISLSKALGAAGLWKTASSIQSEKSMRNAHALIDRELELNKYNLNPKELWEKSITISTIEGDDRGGVNSYDLILKIEIPRYLSTFLKNESIRISQSNFKTKFNYLIEKYLGIPVEKKLPKLEKTQATSNKTDSISFSLQPHISIEKKINHNEKIYTSRNLFNNYPDFSCIKTSSGIIFSLKKVLTG